MFVQKIVCCLIKLRAVRSLFWRIVRCLVRLSAVRSLLEE